MPQVGVSTIPTATYTFTTTSTPTATVTPLATATFSQITSPQPVFPPSFPDANSDTNYPAGFSPTWTPLPAGIAVDTITPTFTVSSTVVSAAAVTGTAWVVSPLEEEVSAQESVQREQRNRLRVFLLPFFCGGMLLILAGLGCVRADAAVMRLGPSLLFSVWGAALAVAALGYYYRRRSPCSVCGRGVLSQHT